METFEPLVLPDGTLVGTGAMVPPTKLCSYPAFLDSGMMLTKEQLLKIITDPNRTKSRDRFKGPDWIKNQGNMSSCNGWGPAQMIEKSFVRRGFPHVKLNGESLYAQINGGKDQGSVLRDAFNALQRVGACSEALWTKGNYLWSKATAEQKADCANHRGFEGYIISDESSAEMELAVALAAGFEADVAVHATNDFMKLDGEGVVNKSEGMGNHSVNNDDVGWSNLLNCLIFDMPNSWGMTYGIGGRGFLTWARHLRSTNPYHEFFVFRSSMGA